MNTSQIVFSLILFFFLSDTYGRLYPIRRNIRDNVDLLRVKRQNHPDLTVASFPTVPFEQPEVPDSVPAPAEYLTPPAADPPPIKPPKHAPLPLQGQNLKNQPLLQQQLQLEQQPAQPVPQITHDKWDLGFDASDILVPPIPDDQAIQYDTLKLHSTLAPELLESFGGPSEQDTANSQTELFTLDSYRAEYEAQQRSKAPVYSFVKTDPNGHFKWGVHIGGPQ